MLDDVVGSLGAAARRDRGVQVIALDSIVGTVGRSRDFDRDFRPRRSVDQRRWERLDRAVRAGRMGTPVEVDRVGSLHFVRDGHHRVSVANALGAGVIDAHVTEVLLSAPAIPTAAVAPVACS